MAYIGRQPTVGNFRICDAISVVNGQAAYTMQVGGVNVIPESANNMIVSLNGVIQKPGSSYTVSSSTITFSSNLSTGDVIDFIQILGGVANIGTPSDGTVTSAKLGSIENATFSGLLTVNELNLDSGGTIHSTNDTSSLTVSGGTNSNVGTNLTLYSGSHASLANVARFRVGSTMTMKIDSSGRITKPLQPAFSATATTTNIPLTTATTVTLSSERFDVGSNLASNIFTAPITGKYLFTYMFYFRDVDADHTTLDVHILTSNKQYQQTFSPDHFLNSDSNFSVSSSVIADMDANDTMEYRVYVSGGGAQTDIHADSQVSGCLLF